MNPENSKQLIREAHKLKVINQKIYVFETINTALPKKKAAYFDKILEPMYAKRNVCKFNVNQILSKARRGHNTNTN